MKFCKLIVGLGLLLALAAPAPTWAGDTDAVVVGNIGAASSFPKIPQKDGGGFWEVLEVVGGGKESVIYKVRDPVSGEIFAAKLLNNKEFYDRNAKSCELLDQKIKGTRFEQYYLMPKDHYPVTVEHERGVVILPYIEGGALASDEIDELIKEVMNDAATRAEGAEILRDFFIKTCTVLNDSPVVWRDYKFENVLVAKKFDRAVESPLQYIKKILASPLIADSGFAVERGSEALDSGHVHGTPIFMSPEAWRGAQNQTGADVYSAAASMLRLLTGKTIVEIYAKHQTPVDFEAMNIDNEILMIHYIIANPSRFERFRKNAATLLADRERDFFKADPELPASVPGQQEFRDMSKAVFLGLNFFQESRVAAILQLHHPDRFTINGVAYKVRRQIKSEKGLVIYEVEDPKSGKILRLGEDGKATDRDTLNDLAGQWRELAAKHPDEALEGLLDFSGRYFNHLLNSAEPGAHIDMNSFEGVMGIDPFNEQIFLKDFANHFELRRDVLSTSERPSLAPEVVGAFYAAGSRATDTFDFGVLLFKLLSGKDPATFISSYGYREAVMEFMNGHPENYRLLLQKSIETELAKIGQKFKRHKKAYKNFEIVRRRILAAIEFNSDQRVAKLRLELLGQNGATLAKERNVFTRFADCLRSLLLFGD